MTLPNPMQFHFNRQRGEKSLWLYVKRSVSGHGHVHQFMCLEFENGKNENKKSSVKKSYLRQLEYKIKMKIPTLIH